MARWLDGSREFDMTEYLIAIGVFAAAVGGMAVAAAYAETWWHRRH